MSDINKVMDEALHRMTKVIDLDQLMKASYEDRMPLTKHQAQMIHDLSVETVAANGFYTLANLTDGLGSLFVFYNATGDVNKVIKLNFPMISKDRKLPKRKWLKDLFEHIGYRNDRIEIKYVYLMIESHIRDGGTWAATMNDSTITFVLKMNGLTKQYLEFHKEDLSQ